MRHLRQLCSILFIFGLASCAYKQVVWPQEPWVEPFMGLDYWIRATFPKSDRASATPTYVRVWAALEPENYYLCDSGGEEIVCFFPFKIVDSLSFFGRWPPEYEVKETDRESDPHHCDERRAEVFVETLKPQGGGFTPDGWLSLSGRWSLGGSCQYRLPTKELAGIARDRRRP